MQPLHVSEWNDRGWVLWQKMKWTGWCHGPNNTGAVELLVLLVQGRSTACWSIREMVTLLILSVNQILTNFYFCKRYNCHKWQYKKWEVEKICNSDKFTLLASRFCCFILHLQGCIVCMAEGPWTTLSSGLPSATSLKQMELYRYTQSSIWIKCLNNQFSDIYHWLQNIFIPSPNLDRLIISTGLIKWLKYRRWGFFHLCKKAKDTVNTKITQRTKIK